MKKKRMTAVFLAAVILVSCGALWQFRERTLPEILAVSPEAGMILRWDPQNGGDSVHMTEEQSRMLMEQLGQLKYRKLATGMAMDDSYASLMYVAEGKLTELVFTRQRGGTLLVNDLERDGWKPIYRILPDGMPIDSLLQSFAQGASQK